MRKSLIQVASLGIKKLNVFIKFNTQEILVGQLKLEQRIVYFKYDD